VEIAGPGFLNIRLSPAAAGVVAGIVVEQGDAYGHAQALTGQRVNLEFVSANPTGPIHIGGARWAAVGDALARLLRAEGADVTTEYYFNDAGAQIDRFARSLLAIARHEVPADDGYAGEYLGEIAGTLVNQHPGVLEMSRQQALETFRSGGVALMFDEIRTSLVGFGVHFDVYFNEKDLHDRAELDTALARLRQSGHVYETDGATWVRTTAFGDDKDRVYVRSNGEFTYFGADCAYYLDKRGRGFGKIVIILGADHHGYVRRMRAIAACFGDDPDQTLEILIGQLVNLLRDGQPLRMSKRAGTVVTIDDIVDAIGVDAARYALARYSLDSTIDLDLDLWTRHSNDNPVYYVQYAHARIASLLRTAARAGITCGDRYDPALLTHDRENDLLKALAEFPAVVASAAELRQPHRVARYLEDLSGAYHRFYDACRVLPRDDDPLDETGRARLWLAEATQIVLANGLGLLGVTAPDRL
jgi:arginyl-tRNA synthetase